VTWGGIRVCPRSANVSIRPHNCLTRREPFVRVIFSAVTADV